jgi:hypothetical protein
MIYRVTLLVISPLAVLCNSRAIRNRQHKRRLRSSVDNYKANFWGDRRLQGRQIFQGSK